MKKFNLKTAIKITPVKAFEFIPSSKIEIYESLGFIVKPDDELNDDYYAELVTDCQVALEGVLGDLRSEGLSCSFEISGRFLDQEEMDAMLLAPMV